MDKKKQPVFRIGIDARMYRRATGGIGRYSREIIKHIAEQDNHNQYFVFLTEEDYQEWDLKQANFQTVVVKAAHYSLAEQTRFALTLYRYGLDLVHFLNFNHPVLYHGPFVVTLHDLTVFHFPIGRSQKNKLRRAAFLYVLRRVLKKAKKVVAISEHSAHDAAACLKIPHAKMEVVYEGGPEVGRLDFGAKAAVQQFLKSRDPYFLFVSQWRPHKGILTLIEAFCDFKRNSGYPHKLVLAGNPKVLESEVRQSLADCSHAGDILTPGFVPEEMLPGLYHFSNALIMPSEYEGFGLPILEAFAYQAPVVAANNSSLPEVVGEAGLMFETGNKLELSSCMRKMADDPALTSQLRARGTSQLAKFSWEKAANKTIAVYMSVLEKNS